MNLFFTSFLILFFLSCKHSTNNNINLNLLNKEDSIRGIKNILPDVVLENKITDTLNQLPFIQEANSYIDSFSNHNERIAFMLSNPSKNETDIIVNAGYSNKVFESYYRFFINSKTMEIKIYDAINYKVVSLDEFMHNQD